MLHDGSRLAASIDELQALCPNLEHVALVVAWFGDDLQGRAMPDPAGGETDNGSADSRRQWSVSGVARATAMVVSTHDGGAAYGGTPCDRSVMDAIAEIKARGLKVTLYPFIMMDIAGGQRPARSLWQGRSSRPIPGAGASPPTRRR